MKSLFLTIALVSASAMAAEPAWWSQKKADCRLSSSLAYNDWTAQGSPCYRSNSAAAPSLSTSGSQLGTAIGNALGDAVIRSVQAVEQMAAENARRRAQMADENRAAQEKEAQRLAEQSRNDARQVESAQAHLQGVLKLSDPDDDIVPPVANAGGKAASPGQAVQTNPGAMTAEGLARPPASAAGALAASSAKGQLINGTSGGETLGQLFDNRSGPAEATVIARIPGAATPAAQPAALDPRLASNKDYQAAAATLATAKAAAEALKERQADLEERQSKSPTPERQIELYNLSGQVSVANGTYIQAENKLAVVKKTIMAPPVIIEDGPVSVPDAQATATP